MFAHSQFTAPPFRALALALLMIGGSTAGALGGAEPGLLPPASSLVALEEVAQRELSDTNTPGAAVAIISGDAIVYAKGFGVASVETNAPVTSQMLFRLGSTTKMFTAAAVVSLAEVGKLRLDEPIGTRVTGLDPSVARLTAHQLLSHSAGLRDKAVMEGLHDDSALAAGVQAMGRDMFYTEPGRLFSYSNPGFWVAGRLAEAVDGRPYADVLIARLFQPLGMTRTTLRPTMAMTWPLAQGHEVSAGKPRVVRPAADNAANWPAGSMFSSVEDLARWVRAFLNEGRLDGRQVLSPSLIKTLATPYVDVPGASNPKYGYGLTIVTRRGVRFVEHGGSRAGYGSFISMAPAERVGIVVVANRTGSSLPKTVQRAAEMVLPLQPKAPPAPRARSVWEPGEAERYAGKYTQGGGDGGLTIVVRDGALALMTGSRATPITKVGPNRFEMDRAGVPEEVVFVLGKEGRAEYVYRGTRALARVR